MLQQLLLSAQELYEIPDKTDCVIVDCRFILDHPDEGFEDYLESHIPGAVYAHLDNDLSSPITADSGRHPLPEPDQFAKFLARSGWTPGKQLIAYDDAGGAVAARLWWLMKYFGHDGATLLDGGIRAWWAVDYDLESGHPTVKEQALAPYRVRKDLTMSVTEVEQALDNDRIVLVDARAPERFSGEIEPIDTVAGRIPGSVNYPFNWNLSRDTTFKTVEEVRGGLLSLAGSHQPEDLVQMCGSGVTACNNIFAAELAGLPGSRLYVGSWSEWIRDPSRPIVRSD